MTQPTGNGDAGTTAPPAEKTFTQSELDRIVADRLARERGKYSDYEDLKAKAAQADSAKSDMDKVMSKLAAMEDKATKAERRALLADVANQTGLSMAKAERLQGESVDELLADAEKLFDAKPSTSGAAATGGTGNAAATGGTGNGAATGGTGNGAATGGTGNGAATGGTGGTGGATTAPPKVTGEPGAGQNEPEMDFGKLADEILS